MILNSQNLLPSMVGGELGRRSWSMRRSVDDLRFNMPEWKRRTRRGSLNTSEIRFSGMDGEIVRGFAIGGALFLNWKTCWSRRIPARTSSQFAAARKQQRIQNLLNHMPVEVREFP